ncbi:MAG: hypothetical protein LBO05_07185 [Deltaproteobacteria bacterium]|jgi:hypothetical protein|nr:hypothetical protein [Deltaproteobacteria bacterium]
MAAIGDEFFRPEIVGKIKMSRERLEKLARLTEEELKVAADEIFDGYRGNADGYLDWYYSLQGGHGRLLTLPADETGPFLEASLKEKLPRNVDVEKTGLVARKFQAAAADLEIGSWTDKYRLGPSANGVVLLRLARGDVFAAVNPPGLAALKTRLALTAGAGGAAGLAAGVAAGRVVSRAVGKIVYKAALRAALRQAAAREAGALAMAAAGAGAGTAALPGAGTVAGLAAGVLAGVAASVAADLGLVKLDEAVNRGEFRNSLIESVELQRIGVQRMIDPAYVYRRTPHAEN